MSVPARARTALWGAAISVALLFVTRFAAFHIGGTSVPGGRCRRRVAPGAVTTFRSPEALAPAGVIVVLGLLLMAAITAARPHALIGYLGTHAAFTAGAAAIAALGLAIAAGMTIALRR